MDQSSYQTGYEIGRVVGSFVGCAIIIVIPTMFIVSLVLAIVKRSVGWTVATVVFALLGMAFIGLSAFAVYKAKTSGGVISEGGKRYYVTSDQAGKIEIPKGWRKVSLGAPDSTLEVGNSFLGQFLVIISEPKEDFDATVGLEDYAEIVVQQMEGAASGELQAELVPGEVGGLPSLQGELNGSVDSVRISYLLTFVEGDSHYFQILCWTSPSKRETVFPIFRTVVDSFRQNVGE